MQLSSLVNWFTGKSASNPKDTVPPRIYGTVVAQSRNPALYSKILVPDTVIGRYDMLALHVFLLTHRLKNTTEENLPVENGKDCNGLSQSIFDLFIDDLERGLRELGYADTSVHKRKKRMVRSYYALIDEFEAAINSANVEKLATVMKPRYFDKLEEIQSAQAAKKLAHYSVETAQFLAQQDDMHIVKGNLNWPSVGAYA